MSATQTVCDLFERFCESFGVCVADEAGRWGDVRAGCATCPLSAIADDSDSCREAFAKLLKASRGEPWECSVTRWGGKGFCSLCGMRVPDGAGECPTCGAVVA